MGFLQQFAQHCIDLTRTAGALSQLLAPDNPAFAQLSQLQALFDERPDIVSDVLSYARRLADERPAGGPGAPASGQPSEPRDDDARLPPRAEAPAHAAAADTAHAYSGHAGAGAGPAAAVGEDGVTGLQGDFGVTSDAESSDSDEVPPCQFRVLRADTPQGVRPDAAERGAGAEDGAAAGAPSAGAAAGAATSLDPGVPSVADQERPRVTAVGPTQAGVETAADRGVEGDQQQEHQQQHHHEQHQPQSVTAASGAVHDVVQDAAMEDGATEQQQQQQQQQQQLQQQHDRDEEMQDEEQAGPSGAAAGGDTVGGAAAAGVGGVPVLRATESEAGVHAEGQPPQAPPAVLLTAHVSAVALAEAAAARVAAAAAARAAKELGPDGDASEEPEGEGAPLAEGLRRMSLGGEAQQEGAQGVREEGGGEEGEEEGEEEEEEEKEEEEKDGLVGVTWFYGRVQPRGESSQPWPVSWAPVSEWLRTS